MSCTSIKIAIPISKRYIFLKKYLFVILWFKNFHVQGHISFLSRKAYLFYQLLHEKCIFSFIYFKYLFLCLRTLIFCTAPLLVFHFTKKVYIDFPFPACNDIRNIFRQSLEKKINNKKYAKYCFSLNPFFLIFFHILFSVMYFLMYRYDKNAEISTYYLTADFIVFKWIPTIR